MSEITNKDLAVAFIERYRAFKGGEVGVPTFTGEQLASLASGLDTNPRHMIQYIGEIGQHVIHILVNEEEDSLIIMDAVISCQRVMISFLISHLITRTRPDIVAQLNAEAQQEEFSWEDVTKNLDFDMPDIGKLQLD